VHALVTDQGLPADAKTVLEEHVDQLVIVGSRGRRRGRVAAS
jgi:hypothetical protein